MSIKYATIDIETTGLNRYKENITFIGVGLSEGIKKPLKKTLIYDFSRDNDIQKFIRLTEKLRKHKVKCVWQNGKFDTLFIEWHIGVRLPISEDVLLMGTAYDLSAEHGLKKMAQRYLGVEDWDIDKKTKLRKNTKDVDADERLKKYLSYDVKYTWELFQFFVDNMDKHMIKLYKKILKPAFNMYRGVERRGIYFDKEEFKNVKRKYLKIQEDKLQALKSKYDINWNSPQQKARVLFKDKDGENLPVLKLTPKGEPSADASTLKKLAAKGYELPKLMMDYTAANTLNKMFLNRWGEDSSYDGRIHPTFNLTNVVSGRTSCTDPNLQQVPRTKDVRGLFHAPKGRCFFEADYSQLELRIAAAYAKEPTMLKIYAEDGDIHTATAMLLTNGRKPTKEERGRAKAVNFGFLYGMGAKKFVEYAYDSYGVTFTLQEAQHFRDLFFAKYSRLLPWHQEQRDLAEALGGVPTLFGRFRKLPDIYSHDWAKKSSAQRRSINTPVQSSGSDILLSAAIQINKELSPEGLCIVGTVHDSILGEFYEEDKDWIVPRIKEIMAHPKLLDDFGIELPVKLDSDCGVGNWGTH